MATTQTVNSNYEGGVAGEIIGQAFKEADTISKGLVTVLPNIDFQISLRKIRYADGRQDYACGFNPEGSITLSEKLLTPKKIKNELELCKENFRQIWSSATMGFSAHNDRMPTDVQQAFIAEILGDTAQATDQDIWQGVSTNAGQFNGFIGLFNADADIIKHGNGLDGIGAPITKDNVVAELEKIVNAIPIAMRRRPVRVMVSPDVAQAYLFSLINPQITNGLGGASLPTTFATYALEVVNGLPANTVVVAEPRNLYFGTGLLADHNQVRIKDMDESDLSSQVRYKMVYTAGVQYVNSEEILYYLSTAS